MQASIVLLVAFTLAWTRPIFAEVSQLDVIGRGISGFGVQLLRAPSPVSGNVCLSPFSIAMALGAITEGAEGETRTQIIAALTAGSPTDWSALSLPALATDIEGRAVESGVELYSPAGLWVQAGSPIRPDFTGMLEGRYGSQLHSADFESDAERVAGQINVWVNDRTRGHIPELVAPRALSASTRLFLANAFYFAAPWAKPFEQNNTEDGTFRLDSTREIKVPFMYQRESVQYAEHDDVQVIELTYANGEFAMLLVLPRVGLDLSVLEQHLTEQALTRWSEESSRRTVDIYVPRFELNSEIDLKAKLFHVGIRDAFGPRADFSGIDGTTSLYLSAAVHKIALKVNEAGTEAIAATGISASIKSIRRDRAPIPVFRADRPFLLFVRHRDSSALLVVARVKNPSTD